MSLRAARCIGLAVVVGLAGPLVGCSQKASSSGGTSAAKEDADLAIEIEMPDGDEPGEAIAANAVTTDNAESAADTEVADASTVDAEESATDTEESPSESADDAEATASSTSSTVLLGDPELTAGIPGEGPATLAEIQSWLDDPRNHQTLEVQLPLGLAAGAAQIQGLDKNPLTRAKIELGRQLYFDPRLSYDQTISCASCHHPDSGYARPTRFGVGIGAQEGGRNSPVSYNRILSGPQFWDGRAATLEDQAVGPIANAIEMGNSHEACVKCLQEIPGYALQFERIFGELTIDAVGMALASFERTIVTGPSPYDYREQLKPYEEQLAALGSDDPEDLKEEDPEIYEAYLAALAEAEQHPMSESAQRGRLLYFSERASCSACHVGPNLTDEKYHNLGVGMEAETPDLGRFVVSGEEKEKGAFKTPTIRNVELTAPYMHDGSQKTLEEVVDWYAKGGHPNPYLSDKIKKLDLTPQDKQDLVEFMKACTGPFPIVETERLPE